MCIYCYAAKFPSFTGPTTPRSSLVKDMANMVRNTEKKLPVMLSDATDPYQPMETQHEITRRCLEVLAENGFPLLIVTKSDLVTRDIDIFRRTPTVVSITITTARKNIAGLIEPYAPPPQMRFSALNRVTEENIPTAVRIDPIIPTLNSDRQDLEKIISKAAEAGVKQVTASTLKPIRGFFQSLRKAHPALFETLKRVYADGEWISGYKYLERRRRLGILEEVRSIALSYGLEFATCREGFPELNTTICDGTAYCRGLLIDNCLG